MKQGVKLSSEADDFRMSLSQSQTDALVSVLYFMKDLDVSSQALFAQLGCTSDDLPTLIERVRLWHESLFSINDLHLLHAAMVSSLMTFRSQEAFYYRIGFFKENVAAVAESTRLGFTARGQAAVNVATRERVLKIRWAAKPELLEKSACTAPVACP